ncbi:hypothetical protein CFSAN002368_27017 [Clostridium botulinum A1 str. CFSAN002368]|nr:hypothetical protein CFSAN002368_27017 [Clostridium botulinum A1 str. CFSAN002368]
MFIAFHGGSFRQKTELIRQSVNKFCWPDKQEFELLIIYIIG